ncbi:MAG: GNAT family N-acetyltransferase [Syntrophales bacterium]|nr:GNAT family N-acetyltransferase [Syntrophales bacterium]
MNEPSYKIDLFRPEDAEAVTRLIRSVYGDKFPVKTAYNPKQLIEAYQRKEFIPFVARKPDNEVIGYTAIYPVAPYHGVYEMGQTVVQHEYRQKGLSSLLFQQGYALASRAGIELLFGEVACNHTHVQKAVAKLDIVETAIEIDLMPAETYEVEGKVAGRVSALCIFRVFAQKSHTVYVPDVYRAVLPFFYQAIGDSRTLLPSQEELPPGQETKITVQTMDSERVIRLTVHEMGYDFGEVFDRLTETLLKKTTAVIQVWMNLATPSIGRAVDILRLRGYFIGGVLLRWFDTDGLLMQKTFNTPEWTGIHLFSSRSRTMLDLVRQDWAEGSPDPAQRP